MRDIALILATIVLTLVLRSAITLEASPYLFGVIGLTAAGVLFKKIKTYRI